MWEENGKMGIKKGSSPPPLSEEHLTKSRITSP